MSLILVSTWSILYLDKWLAGLGGLCDFSVSQSPFGLDFWTLDFGLELDNSHFSSEQELARV